MNINKLLTIAIIFICYCEAASAQTITGFSDVWYNTYYIEPGRFSRAIIDNDSLVISGCIWPGYPGGTTDQLITKLSPNGSVVWQFVRSPGGDHDVYSAVCELDNGNYAFFGQENGEGSMYFDAVYTVFNRNGQEESNDFFFVSGSSNGVDMKKLPNGNLVFSGNHGYDLNFVALTDQNFNQFCYKTFYVGGWNNAILAIDTVTQVIFAIGSCVCNDIQIKKYDYSLNLLGSYVISNSGPSEILDAKVINGYLYLCGDIQVSGNMFGAIYKMDFSGNILDSSIAVNTSQYSAIVDYSNTILVAKNNISGQGATSCQMFAYLGNNQFGPNYTLNDGIPLVVHNLLPDQNFIYAIGTQGPDLAIGIPAVEKILITTSAPSCAGLQTIAYGGQTYNTVEIGTQCWLKENLNIGLNINGNQDQSNNSVIEKYCYNNQESNCQIYGGLYQWGEAMQYSEIEGNQGICPSDWHVATDQDWIIMADFLGGAAEAGGKLKEAGTTHWMPPNTGATNISGFTALPNGNRKNDGGFTDLRLHGDYWTSTTSGSDNVWYRSMYYGYKTLDRSDWPNKFLGFSVRCTKNPEESPTTQATEIQFSNIRSDQFTFNWTDGSGASRAAFIKEGADGTALPVNGTTYTANTSFGSGSQIGSSGWYCVFNGNQHNGGITVTNLSSCKTYRVMVCEYNGEQGNERYDTSSAINNPLNILIIGSIQIPTDGLIVYWPFNGNANDESGHGYNGTVINATLTPDRFGSPNNAYKFNGIDGPTGSQIVLQSSAFNIGQPEYTIDFWFKPENMTKYTQCLFNTIPHTGIGISWNDNNVPGYVGYGLGPANAYWDALYLHGPFNNYQANTWYNIALTKDDLNYSFYINGQLDHTYTNYPASGYDYDVGFRLSGMSDYIHEVFGGDLDDLCLYNRALRPDEIQSLYLTNNQKPISVTSPDGGEQWIAGDTNNITWTSCGVDSVNIEYSLDYGINWGNIINDFQASEGTFAWTVPNAASGQCLIRITSSTNPEIFDISNSVFSIIHAIQPCTDLPAINYGGQTYNTVQIGQQCWLKENLNIGTRINCDSSQTNNGVIEKYCYQDYDLICEEYGGLYQWNEMMQYQTTNGTKGICPEGWHIPTDIDWSNLINFLGGSEISGGRIKESGLDHWLTPNTGANNDSWFTALPGGYCSSNDVFSNINSLAAIWSSSECSPSESFYRNLRYDALAIYRDSYDKDGAFSVRCIKGECPVPDIQAFNLTLLNNQSDQLTFNWTDGSGVARVVFIKEGDLDTARPVDGITYNPSPIFGSGSRISDTWWFCVYNGITHENGVTVTNLSSCKNYCIMVCEYTGTTGSEIYNTSMAINNPKNVQTRGSILRRAIGNDSIPNPWPYPGPFNGGYINFGNFGTPDQFSVSFWINPSPVQNGISVVLDYSHGSTLNWVFQSVDGGASWDFLGQRIVLTPGVWQHVLLTYDYGNAKMFVNGNLMKDFNYSINYSGVPSLCLGNWPEGGRRFSGLVDELYFTADLQYTSSFTPPDVITFPSPNTLGLWHFDEGTGTTTKNSFTNIDYPINSWYWYTLNSNSPVAVTSPNGGEQWEVGEIHDITWSSCAVDFVNIEYSTDDGQNWILVTNNIPGSDGFFSWQVPDTLSDQCMVKITSTSDETIFDTSDTTFSIVMQIVPAIHVLSPNGSERWAVDSTQIIHWKSTGVEKVQIDWSFDGGSSWRPIIDTVSASLGILPWKIPYIPSERCLVKIRSIEDASVYDVSDRLFSIYSPYSVSIFIPNAFTPNGDGLNDSFGPLTSGIISLNMDINDLNGRLIYSIKTVDGRWDGNMPSGAPAPQGVYFYVCNAMGNNNHLYTEEGTVSLYRDIIDVHPNPIKSTGNLFLNGNLSGEKMISLYSLDGSMLRSWQTNGDIVLLEVQDLKPGVYIIKAADKQQVVVTKFIKQ